MNRKGKDFSTILASGLATNDYVIIGDISANTNKKLEFGELSKWSISSVPGLISSSNSSSNLSFLQLNDTPSTYSGTAGYILIVSSGSNGLEFTEFPRQSSNKITFQTGSQFLSVGNIVRRISGEYVTSSCVDIASSEVVGIVTGVTGSNATITISGEVIFDKNPLPGDIGLTDGNIYFLGLTGSLSSTDGFFISSSYISKPVLQSTGTKTAILLNYRGLVSSEPLSNIEANNGIFSGSVSILGNLNVVGSINGFLGTSSYSQFSATASFATHSRTSDTASHALSSSVFRTQQIYMTGKIYQGSVTPFPIYVDANGGNLGVTFPDSSERSTIYWAGAKLLNANTTSASLDWAFLHLSGSWRLNTSPTTTDGIATRGWIESISSSFSTVSASWSATSSLSLTALTASYIATASYAINAATASLANLSLSSVSSSFAFETNKLLVLPSVFVSQSGQPLTFSIPGGYYISDVIYRNTLGTITDLGITGADPIYPVFASTSSIGTTGFHKITITNPFITMLGPQSSVYFFASATTSTGSVYIIATKVI